MDGCDVSGVFSVVGDLHQAIVVRSCVRDGALGG